MEIVGLVATVNLQGYLIRLTLHALILLTGIYEGPGVAGYVADTDELKDGVALIRNSHYS
jgi:hypothetical protein